MLLAAQRTLPSRALKAEPARQRQEGAAGFVAPSGWGARGAQKMDAPQDEHQHGGFGGPRTAGGGPVGGSWGALGILLLQHPQPCTGLDCRVRSRMRWF